MPLFPCQMGGFAGKLSLALDEPSTGGHAFSGGTPATPCGRALLGWLDQLYSTLYSTLYTTPSDLLSKGYRKAIERFRKVSKGIDRPTGECFPRLARLTLLHTLLQTLDVHLTFCHGGGGDT